MSVGSRGGGNPNPPRTPTRAPTLPPQPARTGGQTPNQPSRPGLDDATQYLAYDTWWDKSGYFWTQWMLANPEQAGWIKATAWKYQTPDEVIDKFMQLGLQSPKSTTPGGGSRPVGGGGGGVTKEQQYLSAQASIRNEAAKLGLQINNDSVVTLSKVAVDNNWSNDQLMDYLVPGATNTTAAGTITVGVDQIKKMAANQLLNVSDATAREWASKIASDEMTLESVGSLLQAQATMKYGWAASQINQGVSVRDMMLPGRDVLARELEMDAESIDLMDSKWLGMLQTADTSNGTVRAATESELTMRARKDERWASTRGASVAASRTASMMRSYFGG